VAGHPLLNERPPKKFACIGKKPRPSTIAAVPAKVKEGRPSGGHRHPANPVPTVLSQRRPRAAARIVADRRQTAQLVRHTVRRPIPIVYHPRVRIRDGFQAVAVRRPAFAPRADAMPTTVTNSSLHWPVDPAIVGSWLSARWSAEEEHYRTADRRHISCRPSAVRHRTTATNGGL
jgi:hypothetical protein